MAKARRKRRNGRSYNKKDFFLIMAAMAAGAAIFILINTGDGQANGITDRCWEDIKPVITSRIGEDYREVGKCTGYLYWCLSEAYGVDWGTNSYVDELEDKLQNAGISKVTDGRDGKITSNMRPGDIVIFLDGRKRTHCAILGEQGLLYHAISSGVTNEFTLHRWMALPYSSRNCDRYIVYRGIMSK